MLLLAFRAALMNEHRCAISPLRVHHEVRSDEGPLADRARSVDLRPLPTFHPREVIHPGQEAPQAAVVGMWQFSFP